jgi:hypothetical protein
MNWPVERKLQQFAAWLALSVWIAAIVLPFFGVLSWWITIPIAIVWQVVNGWIFLGIMKLVLPPEKFAEVIEKTKRGETL